MKNIIDEPRPQSLILLLIFELCKINRNVKNYAAFSTQVLSKNKSNSSADMSVNHLLKYSIDNLFPCQQNIK